MKHLPWLLLAAALAYPLLAQQTLTTERVRCLTAEQEEILSHMSIVYLDDGQGGTAKTIRIEGVNVQIVNGLGSTDTTNGIGNLIVGYNELGNVNGDARTGSHNVVVGKKNSYASKGGLVAGEENTVSTYCSALGYRNSALGSNATVTGGKFNVAGGPGSHVSGGRENVASGIDSSILGGSQNAAMHHNSSVAGGWDNTSSGGSSCVSGGSHRTASGDYDWVAGSLFEDN